MSQRFTEELKNYIHSLGVDFTGIGDLSKYDLDENPPIDKKIFAKFKYAVSIVIKLNDRIIDKINNRPTPEYADLYREVNKKLDLSAERVKGWIEEKGFNAYIVLASKIVDERELKGEISHKTIARISGVGWQGKSLLIINPEFGPRFRMATILTDMPLSVDREIENRCGNCNECMKFCPAKAIRGIKVGEKGYFKDRDEAVDLNKCYNKLLEFKKIEGVNATICGICVKVCPWGKISDQRGF
ncbi:MAG: 4Fe-4S dicluster domain-containing protein [Proteobacteria bacterium]|nr:4Fe-4S dicluster domain-containing protein [Pseudomonadota bacterium]